MFGEFGINAGYVEEIHSRYRESPLSVDPEWRSFFAEMEEGAAVGKVDGSSGLPRAGQSQDGLLTAHTDTAREVSQSQWAHRNSGTVNGVHILRDSSPPSENGEKLLAAAAMQGRVYQLLNAYRVRGHLFAHLDPLGNPPPAAPELDLETFGLTDDDLDKTFLTVSMAGLPDRAKLREIIAHLSETYCRSIGVEFTHIEEPEIRDWLQNEMESSRNHAALNKSELLRILTKLTDAEIFEQFIGKRYQPGTKRFSLEGAESMIALLDLLIEAAGAKGVDEIVFGMAHRGRLNVLANILGKNPREIFAAFDDKQPERFLGAGDVKYHLGFSSDRVTASGAKVHLTLTFNPSHLEWVNPVVEGRVRAKQDRAKRANVMPLLIHGDAAFMGQGVVPETLNLAGLEGYETGGTVHVVVNNQIGFTTNPKDARSTRYCTDITRMMKVPVFHVNGEDPEAVIQVTRLAAEFRQRFAKDVVIDMYCYRKHGHNEGDEPRFTQPVLYKLIDKKPTVREVYVRRLLETGQVTQAQADEIAQTRRAALECALDEARKGDFYQRPSAMEGVWAPYVGGPDHLALDVPTGVTKDKLLAMLEKLTTFPKEFQPVPKARDILEKRLEKARSGQGVDWGTAETLAYGTLLVEGHRVRLSGQDVRRGTFSHRHAVLFDVETGAPYAPLAHLNPAEAPFEVYDSPLSESGVLGFEYGYSLDCPDGLILWEAQFGDFLNSAQVIVDQFISSAEDKWLRLSGLVLLLPHGYEGQGPEHSSARIERFLNLAAEDNIQVCNLTTPSQIFHALRRQVLRSWRKPLVIMTPKSLLRSPAAVSTLDEIANGQFQRVIPDTSGADRNAAKRILLCSGKVYYDLEKARQERKRTDVAILRLEQIYPLSSELGKALAPYKDGTPLYWVQEEPRNMGAWYFLNARLREFIGDRLPISAISRVESASPATGSAASHALEQTMLIDAAFAE